MTGYRLRQIAAVLHRGWPSALLLAGRAERRNTRRFAFGLVAVLACALLASVPAQALPSVISINLCTDALVARLADPEQVLGLSPYARSPGRSWSVDEAARFPVVSGTAEEVLKLRPDLVLAGRFTKRATRELLRAHGIRLVELDAVRSLDDAKAQIREAGALLGQPERAERSIAEIDAAVARARRAVARAPVRVLPLQRRGWVSGGGTLLTSMLHVVGLENAGSALSRGLGRQVSLEQIVVLRPDLLLVTEPGERAEDQGTALLRHPALTRLYPPEKRIVLPENLNVICGGPTLADSIERLAAAIERRG